jgi:hypothetical protein
MSDTTLIGALQHIADVNDKRLSEIAAALGSIGGQPDVSPDAPDAAKSDPREELLIRYTVGTGEFDKDKKYNVLRMKMYKLDGTPDGSHDGVWQPLIKPQDLPKRPDPPKPPLDKPEGPIEHIPIRAYTKAIWTFGDGSSVTAVGPATLHLVKFNDDSHIFLVSVSSIITNGEGRYEGAYGVKTALGSTFVPKGVDMFNLPPGQKFEARTVETFRIIRQKYIVG